MPIKAEREYRQAAVFETRAADDGSYTVEGYASTFNDPYVLYSFDGVDYREQVDPAAFDEAEMDDVILQYDHQGRVFARKSNGTLTLSVDDHGLKVVADLSKTDGARALYEDIRTGMVKEMSFAFTVREDSYDNKEHLRTILKIKRVYDVSAVSIPANPSTNISARNFFEGVIEEEARREAERAEKKKKLKILLEASK